MEFLLEEAEEKDLPEIMRLMETASGDPRHPDWFAADDQAYVQAHLKEKGFVILARTKEGETAGFFLVKFPEEDEEVTACLGYDKAQRKQTAVMDSTVVAPEYRGRGLQGKMLERAQARLDAQQFRYLVCTVHPDNCYSRRNMENHGYRLQKTALCYGGLPRDILVRTQL